ncbi:hypothetical protein MUK42_28713 [Musa troglodytarum]|uniref:Uncharacterized protein n=1 Tax=Musa troglodytarum TaxID=320322 RepID=A0A9E7G545_9LILI|nr:hypothetical protein MUK42_28713 [Musa troglodytarum]
MPQVDREALACGEGSDPTVAYRIADLQLESIAVQIGRGGAALTRTLAPVLERKDSIRNPKPPFYSQRFSGGLQVILPGINLGPKFQHLNGRLSRGRRRINNASILPRKLFRPGDNGRRNFVVPDEEPGSPKVSCFGKVLVEGDGVRRRSRRSSREEDGAEYAGCWPSLPVALCCGGRVGDGPSLTAVAETQPADGPGKRRVAAEPPKPAEMSRFASGRRPTTWHGDLDLVVDAESVVGPAARGGLCRREEWRGLSLAWLGELELFFVACFWLAFLMRFYGQN